MSSKFLKVRTFWKQRRAIAINGLGMMFDITRYEGSKAICSEKESLSFTGLAKLRTTKNRVEQQARTS